MTNPVRAFIGVGSNIDAETNIPAALAEIAKVATITGVSTFYRTPPIGRPEQDWYLNGVISVQSDRDCRSMKYDVLRPIETALGRVRTDDAYAARCIDLDLLLHGEEVCSEEDLILPDPDIQDRAFLLSGLLELEKHLILPGTGQALAACVLPAGHEHLERMSAFTMHLRERFLK